MSDQYDGWRARLHAKEIGADVPPVQEDNPDSGYYRMRDGSKEGPWIPVVIWRKDDGSLMCVTNRGNGAENVDPGKTWTYCAKNPIAKDLFTRAFKEGVWLDMIDKPTQNSKIEGTYESLIEELEELVSRTEEFKRDNPKGVQDKTTADLMRNREARVAEIISEADAMFTVEKKPHLEAGRKVDERFHFRKNIAAPLRTQLKGLWGTFVAAEEKRLRDAEAKRLKEEQAAFEAEQAKIQAERDAIDAAQAKLMDEDPIAALTSAPPKKPDLPEPPKPFEVKVSVGGGVGNKSSLKTVWVAEVTDYKAAAEFFHDHAEMKDLIDKLAKRTAKNMKKAEKLPGFEVKSERVA